MRLKRLEALGFKSFANKTTVLFDAHSKEGERPKIIGIAGFRIQRRRAFMKLESTQENLNRIKDIIKEVESQLKSLKKYAERAQRYKQAREELRDIDLALAAKTYSELK